MDNDKIVSQVVNSDGHLYKDSKYAHFSQITAHNKHLFPLFEKATPIKVHLEKGECLYIPKKWWHHVHSTGSRSISINFWFETNNSKSKKSNKKKFNGKPKKFKNCINDWRAFELWTNEYLIDKIDPVITEGLWLCLLNGACAKRISLAEFISKYSHDDINSNNESTNSISKSAKELGSLDPQSYAYLITPSDYEPYKEKHNAKIIDILADDFHAPFPDEMINAQANFWMNFGGIDTGLHYDDDEGILCVVDGCKDIVLYCPEDSKYLYPYPLEPIKLIPHKRYFHYNLYKETHALHITITSAQILETALHRSPNIAKVAKRLQEIYGAGRIIYGIKNLNGVIRYEFYFYGINKTFDNNLEGNIKYQTYLTPEYNDDWNIDMYLVTTHREFFPNDYYNLANLNRDGLVIYSIDLTEEDVIKGLTSQLNLYYYNCDYDQSINLPFLLTEKTYYKDGSQIERSKILTEKYEDIMININTFRAGCLKIGIDDEDCKNMIRFLHGCPYKCLVISLFNKPTEVGLYFFGIVYEAFRDFLIKYNYPVELISLIVDHEKDVAQLQMEVGFHFTKGNSDFTPSRTAFYGLF